MNIIIGLIPIILFVTISFGTGIYYSLLGVDNAFYQLSPTVAILLPIMCAWMFNKKSIQQRADDFIEGARNKEIITMCIIFILSGALGNVTNVIGSVDSTVNIALDFVPGKFFLLGIFIVSAIISTSIGSSLGTVAALSSLVVNIAEQSNISLSLASATLLGGAMFGDNLSLISDTTIAATLSQNTTAKKKLKKNIKVALPTFLITAILLIISNKGIDVDIGKNLDYSVILITPYIVLISLAFMGFNILIVLVLSLLFSGIVGMVFTIDYSLLNYAQDIATGFFSMHEITLLSILIGGLSGLSKDTVNNISEKIISIISVKSGKLTVNLIIGFMVSILNIMIAINTIAIIICGKYTKKLVKEYKLSGTETAVWLDTFSCVIQGIIPYGAQALLIGMIAGISPLLIVCKVYYCYVLALVSVIYILVSSYIQKS